MAINGRPHVAKRRTLELSDRECLPVYVYFRTAGAWGGAADILLAQEEVYRALGLDALDARLKGQTEVNIQDLDAKPKRVTLSSDAVDMLKRILTVGGQSTPLALVSVAVLRRLNAGG